MGNSNSSSKSKSKIETLKYPNCECIKHAKSGEYYRNEKRCMSFEGHNCICNIYYHGYGKLNRWGRQTNVRVNNYEYCVADKHPCICNQSLDISFCKAEQHICRCKSYDKCNASKHKCICNERSWRSYKGCQANKHHCICLIDGPNNCKATKNHPCSCEENYKNVKREEHLGNCKATGSHPCICKFDKSKCQACY